MLFMVYSKSQIHHLLDHLQQLLDHVADAVLDFMKLPVVHEGRRADNLVLLVDAHLADVLVDHDGAEALGRVDGAAVGPLGLVALPAHRQLHALPLELVGFECWS